MSLDEPVKRKARPPAAPKGARTPTAEGWVPLGSDPNIALQNRTPTVASLGRLYAYGGDGANGVLVSSDAGRTWTPATGPWPPRSDPGGIAWKDGMWLVGGEGASDTWTAVEPGTGWARTDDKAEWGPRSGHALVEFRGTVHLLGGLQDDKEKGDVWTMRLPGKWEVYRPFAFPPRAFAAAGVVADKILLLGGRVQGKALKETQVSQNGYAWVIHTVPWPARWGARAVTLGDTLYMIGGENEDGPLTDIWGTKDGFRWTLAESQGPALTQFGAAAVGDHAVVLGGLEDGAPSPKAWSVKPRAIGWSVMGRERSPYVVGVWHCFAAEFGGAEWLIGSGSSNFVASGPDLLNLAPVPNNMPQAFNIGTVHDGAIWVAGGNTSIGGKSNAVCSSGNGSDWTSAPPANWPARCGHCMLSFNDRLWVIGGYGGDGGELELLGDVWSWSPRDGGPWREEASAAFPGRLDATAVVFDGKMWILGGTGLGPQAEAVHWSDNGVDWRAATPDWTPRKDLAAGVIGDMLIIQGGRYNEALTDCWGSFDGLKWLRLDDAPWAAGDFSPVGAARGDAFYVFGGDLPGGLANDKLYRYLAPQYP